MTWFKVDDKLHDHRKSRAAGPAAMGVWVLAGSWSADNLTDGFIPVSVLPRWGRQREASKLVDVGLWVTAEQDGEKGWRFHEWSEMQPSRAQKLAERSAKAEAGRTGGLRSGQSRREASTKQSASRLVEPPTRPDPYPSVSTDVDTSLATVVAETDASSDRFPEFWDTYSHKVNRPGAIRAWAKALKKPGVTPDLLIAAAAAYITWQISEGKHPTYTKHPATWLNAEGWRDERVAAPPPVSRSDEWLNAAQSLSQSHPLELEGP